jgi:predicted HicB family RNase H-like nuclease
MHQTRPRRGHLQLVYSRRAQPRILSLVIPGDLHHRLKAAALCNDQSLKAFVTQVLTDFLASTPGRPDRFL